MKARRLARGQTIREVAEATGIPKDTIAAWEIGLQRPGPERKRRLAEHFGIAVRDLDRYYDVAPALDARVVRVLAREIARELRAARIAP